MGRGRERWGEGEREGVKAVFFKQIRFEEIGLSRQDSHDLHLSITGKRGRSAALRYTIMHICTTKYILNTQVTANIRG